MIRYIGNNLYEVKIGNIDSEISKEDLCDLIRECVIKEDFLDLMSEIFSGVVDSLFC